MTVSTIEVIALSNWWSKIINYEIVRGNSAWRFGLVLLIILAAMVIGRLIQHVFNIYTIRRDKQERAVVLTIMLRCLPKPISVAVFALGLFMCQKRLVFGPTGINETIEYYWIKAVLAVAAIALAYALYRMVDVIEYYLLKLTSKTKTKLDDMLVPVIRKSLRVTIAIIASLWIADGVLGADVKAILLSAGIGGIAIALAAKDTIANFFSSIMIFADNPFQVEELIKINGQYGCVEEVGFRSTRIRTLEGHLVTVPNSVITNSIVDNVSQRPFIRRTSNITITYGSGHAKAKRAVEIIKEILADIPEANTTPEKPPRVYFSDFNDWSLNIYMSYWVKPADYWLYHEVNQRVNLEMMKRFEAEKIEFAFPSQTLYVKKD